MGLLNTKSQSETAWVEGWSVLSSVPLPWVGEGSERFPCVELRVVPWGARPGAGSTLSNNLEPLPSMFYP